MSKKIETAHDTRTHPDDAGRDQNKIAGLEAGRGRLYPEAQEPRGVRECTPGSGAHLRIADLRARAGRAQPAARGGPQEADLRARPGPQGPVCPDAPAPETPRGLAGRRSGTRLPTSLAATFTIFTGWRTTAWESWSPTCRGMG